MTDMKSTFQEIFQSFSATQKLNNQDDFTAACYTWSTFENTRSQSKRLSILYILFSLYSQVSLDRNPFLTFFLELIDDSQQQRFSPIEQHFVHVILENNLHCDNVSPEQVCDDPNSLLPGTTQEPKLLDSLRLKVRRLVDDPDIVVLDENILNLLRNACTRVLSLSENEIINNEQLSNYPLWDYILPNQLPHLINLNHFLAIDIVPILLKKSNQINAYLQVLLDTPVTSNSIEVIHHVLVDDNIALSPEFLPHYISNSVNSCHLLEEGSNKDKQVKQVERFIRSLLNKQIISIQDYSVEIESFCLSFIKLKVVANLYQLIKQKKPK